jgi:hypothetical protein
MRRATRINLTFVVFGIVGAIMAVPIVYAVLHMLP